MFFRIGQQAAPSYKKTGENGLPDMMRQPETVFGFFWEFGFYKILKIQWAEVKCNFLWISSVYIIEIFQNMLYNLVHPNSDNERGVNHM